MSKSGGNKMIKIQGYKGQLTRDESTTGQTNYTAQIPVGSSLITFTAKNATEEQITAWLNTLPIQQIAKLIQ